ncbi:hypothetical protein [Nostoc edaphicum]|nr:hypothetical protein [Nostoc edaphicum]
MEMRIFEFGVTRRGFRRIKVLAVSLAIAPYIHVARIVSHA